MATLQVAEYAGSSVINGYSVPVGEEPAIAQQAVTYTTAATVTLDPNTRFVRLKPVGASAFLEWDGTPAVAGNYSMEALSVEYFGTKPAATQGGSRTFSVYDGVS